MKNKVLIFVSIPSIPNIKYFFKTMLKSPLLLLFAVLISHLSIAQDASLDKIKKNIEKDFLLISKKDFPNLVPYITDNGDGYINATTQKVVLKPTYSELDFFKPNLRGIYNNDTFFEINAETKEVKVFANTGEVTKMGNYETYVEKVFKDNSQMGFKLDATSELYSYSAIYTSKPSLFKYKETYFAIAEKGGKFGIIQRSGETLTNLDFVYSELEYFSKNDITGNIWFKFKNINNEIGLINILGEKKLVNEIIPNSSSIERDYSYFIDKYTEVEFYGYSIQTSDKMSGVLDLQTMEWLIKPQKELQIMSINYSTAEALNPTYSLSDKTKLKFYFRAHKRGIAKVYGANKVIPYHYYIDEKLKKYVPKY
jgi:hypothetical protein